MQHHVYFWLKKEHNNARSREEFERSLTSLCQIPHISHSGWGKPAETPKRSVIDSSFDYGLYLSFDSIASHDAYQEHSEHVAFINRSEHLWEKVSVMDVE